MPLRQSDNLSSASSTLSSLKLSYEGSIISSGTTDSTESGKSLGRGATRGARLETFEMRMAAARTRPTELVNKRGSGGSACKLTSNYFELVRQTNWKLLQYRVDFDPPIELTKVDRSQIL